MTIQRIRGGETEQRGLMLAQPNGWGWNNPGAIPPPGMYSMQRAGVPVTPHTALQVDVVFTALRVISNGILKLGNLRAYTEGLDKDNYPYRQWMAKQPPILTSTFGPNRFQYDGRRRIIMSLGLFGEAWWYTLLVDKMGYPKVIEVLNPALLDVEPDMHGGPDHYWYGSWPKRVELDPDRLTQIPFMAMPGATRGLSSIEYAGVAYALALAAMEFGQRWFAQGASPSFILSTEQKLGEPEVERIAKRFLIDHSGLQSAHLPLVIDSGMKAQKISSTPDEAQFIGTLEYSRMCIASWFGLPAHLAGGTADKGNVWGKTVQEQGFQMEDYTFSGYTVPLEEAHSDLLPTGQFAGFLTDTLTRANAADLAAEVTALRTMQVGTQNEVRVRKYRWPPKPGGDSLIAPLASNVAPGQASAAIANAAHDDNAGGSANSGDDSGDDGGF